MSGATRAEFFHSWCKKAPSSKAKCRKNNCFFNKCNKEARTVSTWEQRLCRRQRTWWRI